MLPRVYARVLGTALLAGFLGICGWQAVHVREMAKIAHDNGNLLRLHILANSDAPSDQDLKLAVRDALIPLLGHLSVPRDHATSVEAAIRQHEATLVERATAVVRQAGYGYAVRVEIGDFPFPGRSSQGMFLPPGEYRAVRVVIGAGEGSNWWCVLFPPLCFAEEGVGVTVAAIAPQRLNRDGIAVQIRWRLLADLYRNRYVQAALRLGQLPWEYRARLNSVEARDLTAPAK